MKKQWCKIVFTETETSYVSCSLTEKWECGKGTTDDSQDIPQYTCVEMLLWINGQCLGFTLSHVYHVVKELTVESRRAKEQTFCGDCCLIYFNFKLYFCKSVPESQMFTRCNLNQCSSSHLSQSSPVVEYYIHLSMYLCGHQTEKFLSWACACQQSWFNLWALSGFGFAAAGSYYV